MIIKTKVLQRAPMLCTEGKLCMREYSKVMHVGTARNIINNLEYDCYSDGGGDARDSWFSRSSIRSYTLGSAAVIALPT
jgi:hypothetical protein